MTKDKDLLERTKRYTLNMIKLAASLPMAKDQNKISAIRIPHSEFRGGVFSG